MAPEKQAQRSRKRAQDEISQDCTGESSLVVTDKPARKKMVQWSGHSGGDSEENDPSGQEAGEDLRKICLTGWCQNGYVGYAYYDPVKCVLYVLEDTQETLHFDLTRMLLDHVQPDVVLTSSRADDGFIDTLRDYMEESGGVFQIRPRKDFIPAKGRDRILSLPFLSDLPLIESEPHNFSDIGPGSEPKDAYEFMKRRRECVGDPTTKRWNAAIRLSNFASAESSPLCIASVGALLDQLVRECAMGDLDDEGISGLEIRDIEAITLEHVMHANADTLFSLQIFNNESHASVHSDKTKEGLSLFGTLNNTKTMLGRSLLRTWLLRPSLSITVINSRQDAVACFSRAENLVTADVMHGHLNGIKNVPRILGILRSGRGKVSEWQGLLKFTFHSSMLRDALTELHEGHAIEIVKKLFSVLDVAIFREIGSAVNEIIDWEESIIAGRVCVRPHIDEELDNRKRIYHGIDSVLSKVAEQISQTVPIDYASSLNVVYFPQLGFLVCVPMSEEWRSGESIRVIDGWTFQFSSDSHVYFKSQEMHDMDIHIGDLHPLIVDREIEIVEGLLEKILGYSEALANACDVCAELDCLLSFAEASRVFGYHRPVMVEDNIIDIKGGRHPLQEQVLDTFVPNDARVVGGVGVRNMANGGKDGWNSMVLCTGANACGKSIYLKQIALIQYMAQVGCFVPAESATLGVVDKIFTRISTRESVSKVQSAFMIDLSQVSLALRNSTPRSLLLLDEFGKGTKSSDGAGLFCGVLKHLLNRGPQCPKVLAATHFHDVFGPDLLDQESLPITFLHMDVMFISSSDGLIGEHTSIPITPGSKDEGGSKAIIRPGDKITYLYRVAPGLSLDSHAAKCAEIFGIPRRIADRSQYVSNILSMHEVGQLLDEEMTEEEILDLEQAETVFRKFLAWNLQGKGDQEEEKSVKEKLAEVLGR